MSGLPRDSLDMVAASASLLAGGGRLVATRTMTTTLLGGGGGALAGPAAAGPAASFSQLRHMALNMACESSKHEAAAKSHASAVAQATAQRDAARKELADAKSQAREGSLGRPRALWVRFELEVWLTRRAPQVAALMEEGALFKTECAQLQGNVVSLHTQVQSVVVALASNEAKLKSGPQPPAGLRCAPWLVPGAPQRLPPLTLSAQLRRTSPLS